MARQVQSRQMAPCHQHAFCHCLTVRHLRRSILLQQELSAGISQRMSFQAFFLSILLSAAVKLLAREPIALALGLLVSLAVDDFLELGLGHRAVYWLVASATQPSQLLARTVLDVSWMGSWESAHWCFLLLLIDST